MAEFFLELFSEEIPAGLQKNLREKILEESQKYAEVLGYNYNSSMWYEKSYKVFNKK